MRNVLRMTYSAAQPYGGSAMIRRVVTMDDYKQLDPFLCLNDSKMSKPTWFKDHPHRGFGSVTYVIKGALRHEDSLGIFVLKLTVFIENFCEKNNIRFFNVKNLI